ncbi:hypothetical protein [Bacillus phage SWEP1]|nr:hypothetical protein [Bacillus phage SWEP1]
MNLEELENKIKQQNELEDKITAMKSASYALGIEIYKEFKDLPEDKILEYYEKMNVENDSLIRFEIFKGIILPNKEKLRRYL